MKLTTLLVAAALPVCAQRPAMLNEWVDVSSDFHDYGNSYYFAATLANFDAVAVTGSINWRRNQLVANLAFNNMEPRWNASGGNTFPAGEYAVHPTLPFSVHFISPRTIRLRIHSSSTVLPDTPSLMLVGQPPVDRSWKHEAIAGGHRYTSSAGSLTIRENPWRIELRDAAGKLLTQTQHPGDSGKVLDPVLPFSFVRRVGDFARRFGAVFTLSPGEKIFGCGESFTRLDKRGQKIVLFTNDANGVENQHMYKPVPFFLSSRGYGMFVHTSAPATFDFGAAFAGTTQLLLGDDDLDLFVFLGEPKDILGEYTALTGRSPVPPLWSFGLWMSRITYKAEAEVRDVAAKLRENKVPTDVIHLDTGWFETDWRCDYQFSKSRFTDPAKMIADLKAIGFHISLWQLPYFVPNNSLFPELLSKRLVVRNGKGDLPFDDAVLDFTNPAAVAWYQAKIESLLRMGVGAIKVDFGEAAPLEGVYSNGRTGFYEHNLYPLRYNQAVADITRGVNHENIIWARSAWAGSQRYPIHWGGDSGVDENSMAATLRGGLSFGLSGFTYWSHDIGGFAQRPSEDLYRRWMPFGMLTSHSRCHGQPPREPWAYSPQFLADFRRADEMKYRLMPYIYAQAKDSSDRGLPMLRALFVEFPNDPGTWQVEDEYLFGSDILVAPLMESGATGRDVYLPHGAWVDYQTGKTYDGGWNKIESGIIPIVMLVRQGAVIPQMQPAQSTAQLEWRNLELVIYGANAATARGMYCFPSDGILHRGTAAELAGPGRTIRVVR